MRRNRLLILTVALLTMIFGTTAYADTEANLDFDTNVQQAVSMKRGPLRSGGTKVSPVDGTVTGDLGVTFLLDTNDTDGIKFVITSSVQTLSSTFPAYDSNGNILFTNTSNLPNSADILQALSHSGKNKNVIVYPVIMTTTSPLTYTFKPDFNIYGNCYLIDMNGETEGEVMHTVGSSPISGTFNTTLDTAGSYQATVTVTAVSL